ncbi:MAG: glycoside hydrolase family 9 protein [Bacteroidetes bacterium]|nr:glycoside hydrolase family 9 protein [Bacteroidota bacterium]
MKTRICFVFSYLMISIQLLLAQGSTHSWIRVNLLGYPTKFIKVAVWCSKDKIALKDFELVNAANQQVVFKSSAGESFGAYGPFNTTYRLNFSSFQKPGKYFLRTGKTTSPIFTISDTVYKSAADFCLRYMRQQRSGFNPFLKDSCHTHDGYTVYAPVPDGTHIDVSGGWHDASDYLQYSATSANATYHLLAAYRDFPKVFADTKQANGLDGKNGIPDVVDEAKWGLDWLLKMHPKDDWLFNQLGDDRDHRGMRIPKEDSFYNKGFERPVYFCSGEPQGLFKYKNRANGVASTAGKFASSFALGYQVLKKWNPTYANTLYKKSFTAYQLGLNKPGVAQTAPGGAPYFYEEDDWKDDMALAETQLYQITKNKSYLNNTYQKLHRSSDSTWMGNDTMHHYQWYPFIQLGVNELAKYYQHSTMATETMLYYQDNIYNVWNKAKHNAFFRGVPFTWCSNNLTTSFAIECYWFRKHEQLSDYQELEQSNFDWLFGCNPWGTSMVYGLPSNGDTPVDPHSAFTHLKNYPIDGGLVDGPVYTSIYKNLIGIKLIHEDNYATFQSDLAVYHDDYGDYSTNEPTMDGTASLIYLLAAKAAESNQEIKYSVVNPSYQSKSKTLVKSHGAIVRSDSTLKELAIVFTADEFGEGLPTIIKTLNKNNVWASFFFTGRFYRNPLFQNEIDQLAKSSNYLGPHSDQHLLYCDWTKRDSTLITRARFQYDFNQNLASMPKDIYSSSNIQYFIPPYEWWNDDIVRWCNEKGITLFNFTPGIGTNADYAWPEMGNAYKSSELLISNLKKFEATNPNHLNGAIILIHAGTDPRRKDKLYDHLDEIIAYLKEKGYRLKDIPELFK